MWIASSPSPLPSVPVVNPIEPAKAADAGTTLWGMPLELAVGLIGLGGALLGALVAAIVAVWVARWTMRQQAALNRDTMKEQLRQAKHASLEESMAALNAAVITALRHVGKVSPENQDAMERLLIVGSLAQSRLVLNGFVNTSVTLGRRRVDGGISQLEWFESGLEDDAALERSKSELRETNTLIMKWMRDPQQVDKDCFREMHPTPDTGG